MDEKPMKPNLSLAMINNTTFAEIRTKFMEDFFAFHEGKFSAGSEAMTHLLAMYYVLPMARHLRLKPEESAKFLDEVSVIQADMRRYIETHRVNDNGKVFDKELIEKTNAIVRRFYVILAELGYC